MFTEIRLRDGTILPHKEHITAIMEAISVRPFYNPRNTEPTSYMVFHNNRWKRVKCTRVGNSGVLWIKHNTDKLIVDTY